GFRIAAVSIDQDDPEGVRSFARELGLTFDILHDRTGAIQQAYLTTGVPESFLLDTTGTIMKRVIGAHDWASPLNRARLRPRLASCVILSQDIHRVFGGVVPELASRAHLTTIGPVVDQALAEAGLTLDEVDGIAVTAGPGLVGALLVGVMYGRTLAARLGIPLIGVHHLEGHLFAPTLEDPDLDPPFVALLVSGGHTLLLEVTAWGSYRLHGTTRDDAAGEAFDKVGTLLGLGYPGGPAIERLAAGGRPGRYRFPRPMLDTLGHDGPDRFTFSFSGLKTALLRAVQSSTDLEADRADLARGFQDALVEVLVAKTAALVAQLAPPTRVLGGGVACNRARQEAAR